MSCRSNGVVGQVSSAEALKYCTIRSFPHSVNNSRPVKKSGRNGVVNGKLPMMVDEAHGW